MSNKPVTENLKKVLADTYTLLIKTHNYHWNVEGANFRGMHLLFEEQYNELFIAIDAIAERIRALGEKAPGTPTEFKKLTVIEEGDAELDSMRMAKDLYDSQQTILGTIKKALAAAEKASDASTADMLTQRITVHDKAAWMLKASIPTDAKGKLKIA